MSERLLTRFLVRIPWFGPRAIFRLQQLGFGYPTRPWSDVVRTVTAQRPSAIGVDVFDTCIIRDLVGDDAIEHLIKHRSTMAEANSGIDQADVAERELCRPVPGVAPMLEEIRRTETPLVFVSDTDRSSELLIDILRTHDLFVDGDQLIASCEAGATKSQGQLFTKTFGRGGIVPVDRGSVWHIGNHLWADVTMAAAAGLRPIPMVNADANRYERSMAARSDGYGPALAGAARLARLEIEHEVRSGALAAHKADIQILGADVAGQVMSAFVLWVADQARSEEIEHLAFLARDGELPLKVAQALPADHWNGRSLLYLHCSRLTWSLAAASVLGLERWTSEGTSDEESFLLAKRHDVPFSALLDRIGLTSADLAGRAEHRALAQLDPARLLPVEAAADWLALLADPAVQQQVGAIADQRLKLIVDYLRSEGIPSGKFGLVDVGWRGRLASQVSAVLTEVVGEAPIHLHFGGENVLPDVEATVPIRRFAFDGIADPYPITSPVSCIETLTASGKPRVVEYRRSQDGEVDLVFDEPIGGEMGDRTELWAGALRAAEFVPSRAQLDSWGLSPGGLEEETREVLDHWWNRPTASEVAALGDLTFEHDEAGTALRPLVAPYRPAELSPRRSAAARQWPQGSAVASGLVMSTIAKTLQRARAVRRRFSHS